jgi:DNA-binding SARP family transcriptional activator
MIMRHDLIPDERSLEIREWPWPVKIYTLGRFEIIVRGQKVEFSRKAQERPIDLLRAILAFGGRKVASESLIEALWPDSDGATGQQNLATNLHRLRQIIGKKDCIIFSQGLVSLNPVMCWIDVWDLDKAIELINPHFENNSTIMKACEEVSPQVEKALNLYKGHFLGSDGHEPWCITPRERLRSRFIRTLQNYCTHLERTEEDEKAIQWYMKALDVENLAEEIYQGLMKCYLKLNRKADAMFAYKCCKDTFSKVLGVAPSAATEALRRQIQEGESSDAGTR